MAVPANLDAFLPREDFFADPQEAETQPDFDQIGILDLRDAFGGLMRKPDFQRTTAAWDPKRVVAFIKSFAENQLIPGVIFWNSPTTKNILVIDGAHRISALLAWIYDDYGEGERSQKFAGYSVDYAQAAAAAATRKMVNKKVGQFIDVWNASSDSDAKEAYKKLYSTVRKRRLPVQWVIGDAETAQNSFFRINLSSVALDKTEQKLIRQRREPNGIATRAIVQNGSGHAYWKDFNEKDAADTVGKAKEIHQLLFSPPLKHPVTTAHLPIGGKAYAGTAMEVALELVEFANRKPSVGSVGPVTVSALQKTWRVLSRINGTDAACLGLHPAIYFYSHATGKHQPAALMAVIRWISEMNDNQIEQFTSVREWFEDFLIENSTILGEAISRRGSRQRSVPTLIDYYNHVLSELLKDKKSPEIYESMRLVPRLAPFSVKIPDATEYGPDFSPEVKSFTLITDALAAARPCRICGAKYHPDSVNLDHTITKKSGGMGDPANARPTHFYCNSNRARLETLIAQRKAARS